MAVSQDFEARRRQRLKMQHKKRQRQRRIQRIVLLIAIAFLAFLLIFNVVKCAKKSSDDNSNSVVTQIPQGTNDMAEAKFDPNIPEPKEGKNDYLDVIAASGAKKHVYLTFDNGPSETITPKILDVLRRYNVDATFFMNGNDIKDHPYLCTRTMEEGHLVLPLSKSGSADILYADKTTFMDEVEETYKLISDNSPNGKSPVKIYRFLGGSYANSNYGSKKQEYKDELAQNGYYFCDWNVSIGDSVSSKTPEQLLANFNASRPAVNNLIIQFNNTDDNSSTAEMLGDLIEKLLSEGYTFSRLDEIEFINEIDFSDDETSATSTSSPNKTDAPTSTQSPKDTATPTKTDASSKTKAPSQATSKPATVTEAPKTVTLPPNKTNNKSNNDIENITSE